LEDKATALPAKVAAILASKQAFLAPVKSWQEKLPAD